MTDPGWAGMWRYAVPVPDWLARRYPSWRAPTELHLIRGRSLELIFLVAALGLAGVVPVMVFGPVRLDEPGSLHLIFAVGPLVLGVLLLREFLRLEFDAEDPNTALHVANRVTAVPQLAAMLVSAITALVTIVTGWWLLALAGAAVAGIAVAYGWPSADRLRRIESSLRSEGYTGDLMAQLLEPRPPEALA